MASVEVNGFEVYIWFNNGEEGIECRSPENFIEKLGEVEEDHIGHMRLRLYNGIYMAKKETLVLVIELGKLLESELIKRFSRMITVEFAYCAEFGNNEAVDLAKAINMSIRSGVKFKQLKFPDLGVMPAKGISKKVGDAFVQGIGPQHREFLPSVELGITSAVQVKILAQFLTIGWPIVAIAFSGDTWDYLLGCKQLPRLLEGSKFTIRFEKPYSATGFELKPIIDAVSGAEGTLIFFNFGGYLNDLMLSLVAEGHFKKKNKTSEQVFDLNLTKENMWSKDSMVLTEDGCLIIISNLSNFLKLLSEMYYSKDTTILQIEKISIKGDKSLNEMILNFMEEISSQSHSLISFSAELDKEFIAIPSKLAKQIQDNLSKKMTAWIKSGTEVIYGRLKVMMVGKGGAGKSSTLRSLLGKPFDRNIESTVVAEGDTDVSFKVQDVSSKWIERNVEENWVEEEMGEFLSKIENNVKSGKQNVLVSPPSLPIVPPKMKRRTLFGFLKTKFKRTTHPKNKQGRNAETETKLFDNLTQEDLVGDISRELDRRKDKQTETEFDSAKLTIWDFGGQEVFYTLHHLFLTTNGIYLLIFDLSLMLNEIESEIRVISFWLDSMGLHASGSCVIMVGTRSNQVEEEDLKKIDIELTNLIENKEVHHLRNKDLSFFPIDNSDEAKIEEMIKPLRSIIHDGFKKITEADNISSNLWQTKVPLSWIYFMNHLMSEFNGIITANQLFQIGSDMGLKKERDILPMLNFYKTAGGIVPFNKESSNKESLISEYIVLSPEWLLQVMASFIYDPKLHKQNKRFNQDTKMKNLLSHYESSGILSKSLLLRILEEEKVSEKDYGFIVGMCQEMLIMSKFDFQPKWSKSADDTFYLVPTMNNEVADDKLILDDANAEDCFSIFLQFERAVPIGLFERVVCIMLTCNRDYDGTTLEPTIMKNFAMFCFRNVEVFLVDESNDSCFRISIQKTDENNLNIVANLIEIGSMIIKKLRSDVLGKKIDSSIQIKSVDKKDDLIHCSCEDLIKAIEMNEQNVKTVMSNGRERLKPISSFNIFSDAFQSILERKNAKEENSLSWEFDCFLAHTWGRNNETHNKVRKVAKLLRKRKLRTWLDEANLKYFVSNDIVHGLKTSSCILIFITELYLEKVEDSNTNASKEFTQAVSKGTEYMVPVVLDPKCLDPRSWAGSTVGYNFSDALYFDFSSDKKIKANIGGLCERIREMSKAKRPRTLFD